MDISGPVTVQKTARLALNEHQSSSISADRQSVLPFYLQALRAQRRLYQGGRGLDGPLPGALGYVAPLIRSSGIST